MNGTITKRLRKNGRPSWGYVFDAGRDETGNRIQPTKSGFSTKAEAAEALRYAIRDAIARADAQRNPAPVPIFPTFSEFMQTWIDQRAARKCEKKTLERYRELAAYMTRPLGEVQLDQLTPLKIQETIDNLQDSGGRRTKEHPRGQPLSAKTVRHIAFVVHGCLESAVRLEVLSANPMDRVELPSVVKSKPHVLDREKMETLLSAAAGTRLFPLLVLAAATGCRRGELLALQWSDLDFESGILGINKSLEENPRGPSHQEHEVWRAEADLRSKAGP